MDVSEEVEVDVVIFYGGGNDICARDGDGCRGDDDMGGADGRRSRGVVAIKGKMSQTFVRNSRNEQM